MHVDPGARWTWVDLRLVPLAAGVWAGTLLTRQLAWPVLALGAVGSAVLAAVLARGRRGARLTPVLLVLLAGLAVSTATGAVRTGVHEHSPLRALAAAERTALVTLELDEEPRLLAPTGQPRIAVEVTVTRVDAGSVHRLDAAAVLFGPAADWQGLPAGQLVRARVGITLPEDGGDAEALLSARGPPENVATPGGVRQVAGELRRQFRESATRVLEPRAAGLVPGLVVGDTAGMDPQLTEDFRRAGLTHLTAVSGANVAIVLTAVLGPLRRRAVDRRVQAGVAVVALVAFVVLVGPDPSVLRAAAMGGVALLALASGRPRAAVPALAAAVSVLLLVQPALAAEAGFALSVAATAAIVLLAPGWSRRLRERGCRPVVADALAVSAAAGLATAPILAGLFGTVSLVSLPANLLAVPAVAPVTVLALPAVLLGGVVPPLADGLVWLAGWPTRWLVWVAERCAALPDGVAAWPAGVTGAVLLGAVLVGGGCALWRFRRLRPLALAALCGLVVAGWPVRQVLPVWPPPDTVLVACDVGQGDALVLPTAPGEGVLVDAGPEPGDVDRCLDGLGIDALPLVLLTHLDADHVGGLSGALTGRRVGEVGTGALAPTEDRAVAVHDLVRRAGGTSVALAAGERRTLGGLLLEVLAPDERRATAGDEPNDLSLVVRVTVGGLRVLLTGDLGADAEARLVRSGADLRAEVLKVPHHGSADVDEGFLAATGARVALISVGADNSYGHPAPSLLTALTRAGMRVHRTDRDGDLAVAGTATEWGVAAQPGARSGQQRRRTRVTRCRGARCSRGTHLPPPGGDGRGGAAACPGGLRRPLRRARPPPRRRAARARRRRPAAG
jgi:competence protein ComEC